MSSEKQACSKCGQELGQPPNPDDGVCAACSAVDGNNDSAKKTLAIASLLPPRRNGSASSSAGSSPLLPPRHNNPVAELQKRDRSIGPDSAFVILPDAQGGFQRVSNRSVRVSEGGTEVHLASRPRDAALRHRISVNVISIVLGLAILFAVFWLAVNGWL